MSSSEKAAADPSSSSGGGRSGGSSGCDSAGAIAAAPKRKKSIEYDQVADLYDSYGQADFDWKFWQEEVLAAAGATLAPCCSRASLRTAREVLRSWVSHPQPGAGHSLYFVLRRVESCAQARGSGERSMHVRSLRG